MYPAIAIEFSTLEARYVNMNIYPLTLFLDKDLFDSFGIIEELCGPCGMAMETPINTP